MDPRAQISQDVEDVAACEDVPLASHWHAAALLAAVVAELAVEAPLDLEVELDAALCAAMVQSESRTPHCPQGKTL